MVTSLPLPTASFKLPGFGGEVLGAEDPHSPEWKEKGQDEDEQWMLLL